jgi:hypothetical protein
MTTVNTPLSRFEQDALRLAETCEEFAADPGFSGLPAPTVYRLVSKWVKDDLGSLALDSRLGTGLTDSLSARIADAPLHLDYRTLTAAAAYRLVGGWVREAFGLPPVAGSAPLLDDETHPDD